MSENIGKRLKKIRTSLGLSQETFGQRLGLSKQAISNVENSLSNPSISFLNKLIDTLNVNINWFTHGDGLMFLNNCENTHAFIKNEKPVQNFKNWGNRFSTILADAQETPYAFSKRTGIKETRIEKFIIDAVEPTISELNAIKSNVDVSIDWLLYGETVENCAQDEEVSLSAEEIILLKKLAKKSVF